MLLYIIVDIQSLLRNVLKFDKLCHLKNYSKLLTKMENFWLSFVGTSIGISGFARIVVPCLSKMSITTSPEQLTSRCWQSKVAWMKPSLPINWDEGKVLKVLSFAKFFGILYAQEKCCLHSNKELWSKAWNVQKFRWTFWSELKQLREEFVHFDFSQLRTSETWNDQDFITKMRVKRWQWSYRI